MYIETESVDDLCLMCLSEEPDPERDDGFCTTCGQVNDKYNDPALLLED